MKIDDLFPEHKPQRKKPRILMHVSESGDSCSGEEGAIICRMKCRKCSYETEDWIEFKTITEAKRGLPCPECNEEK